ncbi:hypothetical protein SAMN05216353_1255 [Halobacillus alkaliphilus]|uniref:Uncharacterized protein n=1 Tax=Halobacillus alkaliphilus TaxID=396056 RepID=A0A1I2PEU8_9BACI|nr:hypothetical protein [Halobacillus alkaliphilus]SFG14594.1 hypothetical protein SAMN05216353_1255 [Halobacillus alkaliphilus]
MKNSEMKDWITYYSVTFVIFLLLFGGIWTSGLFTGVEWQDYWIEFHWSMVNIKELKQIIGL